jgi:glycyl-tRNA synthetase
MIYERDDVEGLDSTILTSPYVLRHSGHEDTFTDPLVDCKKCKSRWRDDQIDNGECPSCKSRDLTDPRPFNLMFKTAIGPIDDGSSFAYLRPETAQQIFVNFKNIVDSTSRTPPFGIAQIGKAFRNEITPRNFIFRVREFEQMELEFFVKPGTDEKWHQYWVDQRLLWWSKQGVKSDKLKLLEVEKQELSHYSKATFDIMYQFPHGLEELEGVANRTDFDLGSHTKNQKDFNIQANVKENKNSTTKLAIQDLEKKEWFVPFVIEPSAGVERGVLAILNEAYTVEEENNRTLLKLKSHLSPIKAAIIPLKRNNVELVDLAHKVKSNLQSLGLGRVMVENSGNIGKNYRRHDEIGTPMCITIDFESLENQSVTIRDRDSMKQERVNLSEVENYYMNYFK